MTADHRHPPPSQIPDKCKIGRWDKMVTMIHLLSSYSDPSRFSLYASYRVVQIEANRKQQSARDGGRARGRYID